MNHLKEINTSKYQKQLYQNSPNKREALNKARQKIAQTLLNCKFCNREFNLANIKKHENSCIENPKFDRCPVCNKAKNKKNATCSTSCANIFFRSGSSNGNWKEEAYRSTCFAHHKKECVICFEKNIVEVHHLDEDRTNFKPENLIPLCPTHHQYWHSRFRHLIEQQIRAYLEKWKQEFQDNG